MEGFDRGLDGYYDAGDVLRRYLLARADRAFAAAAGDRRGVEDREAAENRRERVRETFLDRIGGLPDAAEVEAGATEADLGAETVGRVECDGYRIERVVIESLPGFRVTANRYVPDGDGPHPAVLFLCGHTMPAKADPENQRACVELARNGVVVLAVDPIAQGERRQYRDPESGEELVGGGGGVFAHCYAGRKCFYAGGSLARYFLRDARRALSYLAGRSDVDADRIAAVGTSGGGIQVQYLAAVEDRLAAAVPCCSVTTRAEWLKTGKRIDAEQLLHDAFAAGLDHDDLLAGLAPTPVCVGAAASDEYFPIEGTREAVERLRSVYARYGAADAVDLVVADEQHCSVYDLGDPVFEWICDQLGVAPYEPVADPGTLDEAALHCTPEGSVRAAYPDERTIDDLVAAFVADREADPAAGGSPGPGAGNGGVDPDRVRRAVVDWLDLDRDGPELHPRFTGRGDAGDPDTGDDAGDPDADGDAGDPDTGDDPALSVDHVFFPTERDPDALVAGVLVSDPDAGGPATDGEPGGSVAGTDAGGSGAGPDAGGSGVGPGAGGTGSEEGPVPAVVCYEEGTEALPERREDLAALAREHGTVFAVDPRGVGALRNRAIPVPTWVEDYHGGYGTEFKLAYDALMLGDSLFGMRVYDTLRAVEFLRAETGRDEVALVGEGVGAAHALYAAVADPGIASVELRELPPGFREMATAREYPYDPRLTVFDGLGDRDRPACLAALDARGVDVTRTGE